MLSAGVKLTGGVDNVYVQGQYFDVSGLNFGGPIVLKVTGQSSAASGDVTQAYSTLKKFSA